MIVMVCSCYHAEFLCLIRMIVWFGNPWRRLEQNLTQQTVMPKNNRIVSFLKQPIMPPIIGGRHHPRSTSRDPTFHRSSIGVSPIFIWLVLVSPRVSAHKRIFSWSPWFHQPNPSPICFWVRPGTSCSLPERFVRWTKRKRCLISMNFEYCLFSLCCPGPSQSGSTPSSEYRCPYAIRPDERVCRPTWWAPGCHRRNIAHRHHNRTNYGPSTLHSSKRDPHIAIILTLFGVQLQPRGQQHCHHY